MRRILITLACAGLAALAMASTASADIRYSVGIGSRSIAVDPDGNYHGLPVYLGGFGLGGPPIGNRHATGNLAGGPSVRAISIGDGTHNFAIADIEVQGWFAATKDGPLGLVDMRKAVEAATHGGLKATEVVIQSDHTHGGPDMMGVWGGAPIAYRQFVFHQTVDAIVEAFNSRQKGTLFYGTAPGVVPATGERLLNNQFDYDSANKVMDSDVRVLQARDATGRAFATMLNFSAHATVLGSDNTKATGDWVQTTNPMLEEAFGGKAMTVVGTLGRTQPNRQDCAGAGDARNLCKLDVYSRRVVDAAKVAVANAKPMPGGKAVVATESFLITDPASNPLLLGMLYGGALAGIPINRSMTPPFMTGNVIGTITASARIGNVLLSSGPGEMYPQIPLKVRALMPGIGGYMTAGLANDQLGYLIAPFEAYPEPIKTSFFDSSFLNGDQIQACIDSQGATCDPGNPTPDPIGNDNYFFNVSHTMGERVTCSLLRGAGDLFKRGSAPRDGYDRCALFVNDALLGPGFDVDNPIPTAPAVPSSLPPLP
ncbi:MAG: hypothetical protein QOI98_1121 [Solirubrobacteraceae bacterium]|nr:hypothetical protein [Solirubrobacteraceae bacterium]